MNYIFNKDKIIKTFDENRNSHAFLINTNNNSMAFKDIIDIIKYINCKTKKNNCKCKSCTLIDNLSNPDLVIIKPDGKEIKKESIDSLMKIFQTTPLISEYSTYIVLNADQLNSSSSNKILKFLEEPEKKIIGFFITDKLYNILNTIKSRCQIFDSIYEINNIFDYFNITKDEFDLYFDDSMKILEFINTHERFLIINYFKKYSKMERVDLIKIFGIIESMYKLKFETLIGKEINFSYSDIIIEKITENDYNIILRRIKLLNELIDKLKLNVNKDLAITSIFLEWM